MDVFPGSFSKFVELWSFRTSVCLLRRQTIPTPWYHCSTCSFLDFLSNDHHQSRQFTIAMNLYFNNYNPGHNIFELYNVLVQVRLATNKPKLDIQYKKLGIRVALRVAKRLNIENLRKLRILKKILKFGWIAQCPASLAEIKLWKQQSKHTQKWISNFSFSVQFYWIFPGLSRIV